MNNSFFIVLIYCFFSIGNAQAQTGKYIYKDSHGHTAAWIELFESGRFEIMYGDDGCGAYCAGAGVYEIIQDSVQLKFFQTFPSQKEITECTSNNKKAHISVQVFRLQDSSIVESATVFARDSSRQKFYLQTKVDAKGMKSFSVPKRKTIKYMRVYAPGYLDCTIAFAGKKGTDYSINIYLSKNPLIDRSYTGPIETQGSLYMNDKNEILFGGVLLIKEVN